MNYNNWVNQLFEATYPRYDFKGGSVSWVDEEKISVSWNGKEYSVEHGDFYDPEKQDPLESILLWAHSNLPLAPHELPEARIYWNDASSEFKAVVKRSGSVAYSQTVSNPEAFPLYGVVIKEDFEWSLQGTILCIESKVAGIPALCPLSHPITFSEIVDEFFYLSEDIHLMFQVNNGQRVFIGNINPMDRIKDEDRGVLSIPLNKWVEKISKDTLSVEES